MNEGSYASRIVRRALKGSDFDLVPGKMSYRCNTSCNIFGDVARFGPAVKFASA
jgi:hypothetical protein